ncbi:aminodeoxychorismate synthase component I [Actibacterium sp. XHP0104]|uniref:aminodeoxychorismate synthase component I n=1 Tax=Actibacterium sp. XHP0104 TaxID=2984335 RepID=UPI0021E7D5A0|nr:aminodeoxychorismate synthase component I [Actibacterium sp. XHP0104]MCV2880456.1 aminodeoxychorismate synthase component I [Actibacterium sp. XHP0104]
MSGAYVYFDQGPLAGGTLFEAPRRVIRAWQPDEVPAALAAMHAAHEAGQWLAGMASYELGYLYTAKLRDLMPEGRDTPLLEFGVFDAPRPGDTWAAQARALAPRARFGEMVPAWQPQDYAAAFDRLHAYIGAGDIYQANLTFPIHMRADGPARGLYAALTAAQPVPHGACLDLGGPVLLSRSPELFFRVRGGVIETRPMKGTQPRGATPKADADAIAFLAADEKNRAENLMIVDLLRNDISRVCRPGTVKVPELFKIETYATVHQMTSLVRGELVGRVPLADLFEALFPCGSITGAPKIRAMQIIRELEPAPRGAYCGAMGWVAPGGDMAFNVAIRTLTLLPGGMARLNVGGGVVWDSTAETEYEEALWKARYAQRPQAA